MAIKVETKEISDGKIIEAVTHNTAWQAINSMLWMLARGYYTIEIENAGYLTGSEKVLEDGVFVVKFLPSGGDADDKRCMTYTGSLQDDEVKIFLKFCQAYNERVSPEGLQDLENAWRRHCLTVSDEVAAECGKRPISDISFPDAVARAFKRLDGQCTPASSP